MIYLFKLTIINNRRHVIYESKHITYFPSLYQVFPFFLPHPIVFVIKKKKICHKRGWVWSRWYIDYLLKYLWSSYKEPVTSKTLYIAFPKKHLSKTIVQKPGLEIHSAPNLFTLTLTKQNSVRLYKTFNSLLCDILVYQVEKSDGIVYSPLSCLFKFLSHLITASSFKKRAKIIHTSEITTVVTIVLNNLEHYFINWCFWFGRWLQWWYWKCNEHKKNVANRGFLSSLEIQHILGNLPDYLWGWSVFAGTSNVD